MKCPKCGYNSFDHLDSCKKCNIDLTEHKARFNIQSILLSEMPTAMAATLTEEIAVPATTAAGDIAFDDFGGENSAESADDFGFDFMGDSEDDENLAFDELFEEVSSEDDVEETLPAPESDVPPEASAPETAVEIPATEPGVDDFAFDEADLEIKNSDPIDPANEAAVEFGFDTDEDPAADIFAETEEDFSLDALDLDDKNK